MCTSVYMFVWTNSGGVPHAGEEPHHVGRCCSQELTKRRTWCESNSIDFRSPNDRILQEYMCEVVDNKVVVSSWNIVGSTPTCDKKYDPEIV